LQLGELGEDQLQGVLHAFVRIPLDGLGRADQAAALRALYRTERDRGNQ